MQTTPSQELGLAKPSPKKELKDWLASDTFKGQLASILPKGLTAERFVRIAFQATFRNPKLLNCSQESFFNCLLQLGAMGLEPDGRNAHLVPYGNQCTLIVDYKGLAQIMRRNGDVSTIHCDVVYSRDEYEAEQGTNQHLHHRKFCGPEGRGTPILAYSFVRLNDLSSSQEFEEMTLAEIEDVRRRSRTPDDGPWVTDWDAMARKTVFRRHAKTLPLSPQTRDALEGELDGDALAVPYQARPLQQQPARVLAEPPKRPRGRPPKQSESESPAQALESAASEPIAQRAYLDPARGYQEGEPAQEPPLHERVRELVTSSGYTEAQMLAAMVSRKMAKPEFTSLSQCMPHHLSSCIEEWDAAFDLLKNFTAKPPVEQLL